MTPFDPRLTIIAQDAKVRTCHVFHCWHALKAMGKQFHAQAFATFAGIEERHVARILEALAAHSALPEGRAASGKAGTRLPLDWSLSPDLAEWAMYKRRWTPDEIAAEAEKFANFWHSKSGSSATKMDWDATWRNWVLNSNRPDGLYTPAAAAKTTQEQRAALEARAALYERMGRDTEAAEIRRNLAQSNVVQLRA